MGPDHRDLHQLLWSHSCHWGNLQVLGSPPQLRPQHLLHHLHPGLGIDLHPDFGIPMEAGDSRIADFWGGVPVLRLDCVVCFGQRAGL